MRHAFVLIALVAAAGAEPAWKPHKTKNGVTVEKREVPGSKFFEHRAEVVLPAPPEKVERAVWSGITDPPKTVKKRTVLHQSENEFLVYDELRTPVVSDRDATIRIWRAAAGDIRFETQNHLGPPPNPKYVRLPVVRGRWLIAAEGAGSKLVYTCYSEPGGSVPAWIVRGPQADQLFVDVERIRDRLGRL